jgi:hypothetical protein
MEWKGMQRMEKEKLRLHTTSQEGEFAVVELDRGRYPLQASQRIVSLDCLVSYRQTKRRLGRMLPAPR